MAVDEAAEEEAAVGEAEQTVAVRQTVTVLLPAVARACLAAGQWSAAARSDKRSSVAHFGEAGGVGDRRMSGGRGGRGV